MLEPLANRLLLLNDCTQLPVCRKQLRTKTCSEEVLTTETQEQPHRELRDHLTKTRCEGNRTATGDASKILESVIASKSRCWGKTLQLNRYLK